MEPTIEQLDLIKLAVGIWKKPSTIIKLEEYLQTTAEKSVISNFYEKETQKLSKKKDLYMTLYNDIEKIDIDNLLKKKLAYIIKQTGDILINLLLNIYKKLEPSMNLYPSFNDYMEKLCWTPAGTIDQMTTFNALYHDDSNDHYFNINFMFEEACNLCQVDCIETIWLFIDNNMRLKLSNYINDIITKNDQTNIYLLEYWRHHICHKSLCASLMFGELKDKKKSAVKMFISSVLDKNITAVNFFLKKISYKRDKILLKAAKEILFVHPRSMMINILYFLLQKMKSSCVIEFFNNNKVQILDCFYSGWPFKYICLVTSPPIWSEFKKTDYWNVILNILMDIVDQYLDLETSKFIDLSIIFDVWKNSPDYLKNSIINMSWTSSPALLSQVKNIISAVSFIKDDNNDKSLRQIIYELFEDYSDNILINQQYSLMDTFLNDFLQTADGISSFKKNIDIKFVYGSFLSIKKYKESEQLLKWYFKTADERNIFKINWKNSSNLIEVIFHNWNNELDCMETIYRICKNHCCKKTMESIVIKLQKFLVWFNFLENDVIELKGKFKCIQNETFKFNCDDCIDTFDDICDEFILSKNIDDKLKLNNIDNSGKLNDKKFNFHHKSLNNLINKSKLI